MDGFLKFINNNSKELIATVVILGITLLLIFVINFVMNRFIKRQKNKRVITITKLIKSIIRYALLIIILIVILGVWNVDVMPIVTGVGVVGLVIGLGAQTLIKDLIAGITIVFDDYYDVDDVVEINGFKGTVLEIGLRSTKLVNWKGEVKIIANGEIIEIINYSRNPSVGIVEFDIAYEENINRIFKIIEENLEDLKETYPQIIEGPNIVGIINVGNAVTIRITVKTASEQHYAVERGIRKYLKEVFEKHQIKMPFSKNMIYDKQSEDKL